MNKKQIHKLTQMFFITITAVLILSLAIYIPAVRNTIIALGEWFAHRPLTHAYWHAKLLFWESRFLVCLCTLFVLSIMTSLFIIQNKYHTQAVVVYAILACVFLLLVQPIILRIFTIRFVPVCGIFWVGFLYSVTALYVLKHKWLKTTVLAPFVRGIRHYMTRQNGIYLLAMFIFLFFCYFALLISHCGQAPWDEERVWMTGMRDGYLATSRYIASFLLILLHASRINFNVAPLMNIIGIAELATVAVILAHVFSRHGITKISLLATLPAVLSPWFMETHLHC